MRLDTNRVVLSSSERTMAPSDLLLNNSYNPGNPVTAMILLYSILMCIDGPSAHFYSSLQRTRESVFRDMQVNVNRSFAAKYFRCVRAKPAPGRYFFSASHNRCIRGSADKTSY